MNGIEQNRLRWKCRRGLLELDLVLERYLSQHPGDPLLSQLLELPDNDLWDIISGRSDRYEARLGALVERLRAA